MRRSELVEYVRRHENPWYRNIWGGETAWERLPVISRINLIQSPLSIRRYEKGKSLVKLVRTGDGMFATEWRIEDISHEPYGATADRPWVYFTDAHESVEKGLWCYEHGMTRLIGEKTQRLAEAMARAFHIDALITDTAMARALIPFFQTAGSHVRHITIIDRSFDRSLFAELSDRADEVRLLLALPETGAIGISDPGRYPNFTAGDSYVEVIDGHIVVTRLRRLVTPIIRFDTGIAVEGVDGSSFRL